MTKKSLEFEKAEALIDGLEMLVLQDEVSERMADADEKNLSQSMQLILAASAARAKLDSAPASHAHKKPDLKKSVTIKLGELRRLLTPRAVMQPQWAASFEGDMEADDKKLDSLIDDVMRVMLSKRILDE